MRKLLASLLLLSLYAAAAHAQCASPTGGPSTIANCPGAVNPQPSDLLLLMQQPPGVGQTIKAPGSNRQATLQQISIAIGSGSQTVPSATGVAATDTANIQAAAAAIASTGGTISFPTGNYVVNNSTTLPSNTRVTCSKGTIITAAPAASWPSAYQSSAFQATSGSDMEIAGCNFQWTPIPGSPGHILNFQSVTNLSIHDNISNGGGDFSAMIGVTNGLEIGNTATNVTNSCYDHWGGFTDIHTNFNYCTTYATPGVGVGAISFTGILTGGGAANSFGFEAIGNVVYMNNTSAGQCYEINGHPSGGTDDNGRIIGNSCVVNGSTQQWGYLVTGHVNHVLIADNQCSGNGGTYSCVQAQSPATNIEIDGNQAYSWAASNTNGIFSNQATGGGSLINNKCYSCTGNLVGASQAAGVVQYGNDTGTGTLNLANVNITSGSGVFDSSFKDTGTTFQVIPQAVLGWNGGGAYHILMNSAINLGEGTFYQSAGIDHWFEGTDGSTQSGGNTGDNYEICNYSDTQVLLGCPLTINRQTGLATIQTAGSSFAPTGALKAGRFYGPIMGGGNPANAAVGAANTLYAMPFFVPATSLVKTLSFDIGTGNAAAWNARMCVYADNNAWNPGSLVANADSGTIAIGSGSVTGVQTSPTLNSGSGVSLPGPAWYWLAFMADSASESVYSSSGGGFNSQRFFGDSIAAGLFNGVTNNGVSGSQTFGACPGTFPSPSVNRNATTPFVEAGF